MKKILLLAWFYSSVVNAQTIIPGGTVSGTWTLANSPYHIEGNILIPNSLTLAIEPGVSVNFQGSYKLLVLGRLLAIGTATDTIIFTSASTSSGWQGLQFDNTPQNNDTSILTYCKIQYATGTDGGALYFSNFSKAVISNCLISQNTAKNGGGIYCTASSPVIINNYITNNSLTGYGITKGGGIYCETLSDPLISGNSILNNSSVRGGGICCEGASPTIKNNIISNNSALDGGGVFCYNSNSTLSGNTISANTGIYGGGICCEYIINQLEIIHNRITNNTATYGGGIFVGQCNLSITNNTITNNNASENGGGICFADFFGFDITVLNTTISANAASKGGAIFSREISPVFRNCILWNNAASETGAQVHIDNESSDPHFFYCNVQGGVADFGMNSNIYTGTYANTIDSNPLFVVPSGGSGPAFDGMAADWSLKPASPCIDAGDTAATYIATDLAGNPRVSACKIDMGAYEYQSVASLTVNAEITRQITYYGDSTGEALATATGGSGSFTYSWNTSPPQTVNIVRELAAIEVTASATNTDCEINNGAATVSIMGGAPPYSYLWSMR